MGVFDGNRDSDGVADESPAYLRSCLPAWSQRDNKELLASPSMESFISVGPQQSQS